MKYIISALILLGMCACLKAPHDHPFDPENPNKAYIGGTVYKYDGAVLSNVDIKLYYPDTVIYDETMSDKDGDYYFEDIDPGIYMMIAKYSYYAPVEVSPCSLPAETYNDTFDLWVGHMYFPFEDEDPGTIAPRAFSVIQGVWAIANDPSDPEIHSTPRVYSGSVNGMQSGLSLINDRIANFCVNAHIKVIDEPGQLWGAGLLLRYKDPSNFYGVYFNHHYVALIKNQGGVIDTLAANSTIFFLPNQWYCLEASCCDDSLHIFVNDEPVLKTADNTFLEGNVGLWVINNDADSTKVHFDDIDIWP